MIRPEVQRNIRVWAEPICLAVGLVVLLIYLIGNARVSNAFLFFEVVVCLGLAAWLVNAVVRARLKSGHDATGIVLVDEGRIGHFGPEDGGFVDIDALSRVSVSGTADARVWQLYHDDGPPMTIPAGARDADQLIDFLASLDGVTTLRIASALSGSEIETIWTR